MDLKSLLYLGIEKMPECRLINPLKEWNNRRLDKELAEVKVSITQGNWNLVMRVEELKALLADPRVPEERKKEFREKIMELDRKVAALREKIENIETAEKETK